MSFDSGPLDRYLHAAVGDDPAVARELRESFAANTRELADLMRRAITAAKDGASPLELLLKNGDSYRTIQLDYRDGLRYPHLERIPGRTEWLGRILAPR